MIQFEVGKTYFGGLSRRNDDSGKLEYDKLLCIDRRDVDDGKHTILTMRTLHLVFPCLGDGEGVEATYLASRDDNSVEYIDYRSAPIYATDVVSDDPEVTEVAMLRKHNKWLGNQFRNAVDATYPLDDSSTVTVKFTFSESSYLDCSEDKPIKLSLKAAEAFIKLLDRLFHIEGGAGYDKTDVSIEHTPKDGETDTYSFRYDIGADSGSLYSHVKQYWKSGASKKLHEQMGVPMDAASGTFWVDLLKTELENTKLKRRK